MDGSVKKYPTPSTIEKIRRNPNPNDQSLQNLIQKSIEIAEENRFFHWELEFPEVFSNNSTGFDCILGNPPWEKVKVEEREWFTGIDEEIANANSKSQRTKLINKLKDNRPDVYDRYQQALIKADRTSKFISKSGRYPLSSKGDVNTYPIFTELSGKELVDGNGRTGIVVKTGVATDYYTQDLFRYFVENRRIVSLYDFVNEEKIFPDVAAPERFCLLTIAGEESEIDEFSFSFYNRSVEMVQDESRRYSLSPKQIATINPNSKNCPVFENVRDKEITLSIYENHPVIINEEQETNPWGISYHRLFDSANDSDLFSDNTLESLQDRGHDLDSYSIFRGDDDIYYPLYEAKYFHQFDHRFGTFEDIPEKNRFTRRASTKRVSEEVKQNLDYEILPRYWVHKSDFEEKTEDIEWDHKWVFVLREIVRVTSDSRTALGTLAPYYGYTDTSPILTFKGTDVAERAILFTNIYTSFTFDFALRQSLSGAHVTLYLLKQLPMPTPEQIKTHSVETADGKESLWDFLLQRGLKLIWTSHSLDPLGDDVNSEDGPYVWDTDERRTLRAEIDAALAQRYGISRDDLEYILDSFDILARQEIEKYGEFRQKQECLAAYDRITVTK
jgi:hypothetical protein